MSRPRTSLGEVRGMFTRVVHAAQAAGIDTTGWTMQEGSTSAGRAWRLFGKGGRDVLGSDGFLGTTARDASISLHAMARVLELVQRPQLSVVERGGQKTRMPTDGPPSKAEIQRHREVMSKA